MIDVKNLRGIIVRNGYSQAQIASKIGITSNTFYRKMKAGIFNSEEMETMIDVLKIQDPASIFFAKNVS